ncbi:YqgE/AlgH family protein [Alcanivorax sp. 1008]|uniref:YqgE/AlgH family protein n=1 Tax=Alcanivorax sp. 1008 TaxID=2816853 RepID=UPI001D1B76F8|nr:YqgE/AlgH family protein [Alcanivorax sp. 1008]MCC1495923.1 YqgE/AlgH family protein [Alcanivorax sp. 1008]
MSYPSLKNHFLIAMPQLADPNFHHSVIWVVEHSAEGAMGLTVNRPSSLTVDDILEDLSIEHDPLTGRHQVVQGGPMRPETGFILHPSTTEEWTSSQQLMEGLQLTTSRDILEAIAAGHGPNRSLTALGYAGWGPGQLEQEMLDNTWLSVPADAATLFDVPISERWQAAANTLGVDIRLLSGDAGHA